MNGKRRADGGGYALAALKAEEYRQNVTDARCKAADITADENISAEKRENKLADKNTCRALESVSDKNGETGLPAEGSYHIGSACVAAAAFSYILTEAVSGKNNSEADASEQIA